MKSDTIPQTPMVAQHAEALEAFRALMDQHRRLQAIADRLTSCLRSGGTIFLCGNGGSAADAQHVAAEFVGRFLRERQPLPAIALTCNTSILTALGNDYDFSEIFARQIKAHVRPIDVVVGISTSGKSPNVIKALVAAREAGATAIGFTGASGHDLASLCDESLLAPSDSTPRIQEVHLLAWHLICEAIERDIVCSTDGTRENERTN